MSGTEAVSTLGANAAAVSGAGQAMKESYDAIPAIGELCVDPAIVQGYDGVVAYRSHSKS